LLAAASPELVKLAAVAAPVTVTLSNNGSANATPIAFVLGMIHP
jgi:hypothetical protein